MMNSLKISVIIPTFNRWETLQQTLSALKRQSLALSNYEIILINDGSTDEAYKKINNLKEVYFQNLTCLSQENKGPAGARNLGIKNAGGDILLFIGDDIIATENLLERHLLFHTEEFPEENFACLGYITWKEGFKSTPFLDFAGNWAQFLFRGISHKDTLDYNHFYSSNISLKKNFLLKNNLSFDENFKYAAWEDIEFGYRLEKKGLKIIFNKDAIAFHSHIPTIESAINRMETSGKSLFILLKKWPELAENFGFVKAEKGFKPKNRLIKKMLRNRLSVNLMLKAVKLLNKNIILNEFYRNILLYHLQKGFEEEQKNCQA